MPAPERGWLVAAPRYLQLAAPDWAAAAVRAMTLHAADGQLARAATAARTAVLVSGGLADLGGDLLRDVHAAIAARAAEIAAQAGQHADGCVRAERAKHVPVQSDLGGGVEARATRDRRSACVSAPPRPRPRRGRPVRALDRLAGLQVLVDLEEVLDLQPVELGHVGDVLQMGHPRVARGYAKELVVRPLLVGHLEHPDDPRGDQATRKRRLFKQHERVKRVTVSAQGVLDEPVVGRVPGRGEQHAVKPDPAGPVIDLVLVPLAPGDFDDYFDVHDHSTR